MIDLLEAAKEAGMKIAANESLHYATTQGASLHKAWWVALGVAAVIITLVILDEYF